MDISIKRKELINWLQKVDDFNLLLQIEELKNQGNSTQKKKSFTIAESKKLSLSKIDQWQENQ